MNKCLGTIKNKLKNKNVLFNFVVLVMMIFSLICIAQGSYMIAKAQIAQYLLKQAWQNKKTNSDDKNKPWPWADFYPVAKLNFERFNIEQIVLNNDSGQALAFGPGLNQLNQHLNNNGESNSDVLVISAHNDTHFSLLKDLKLDDTVSIMSTTGITQQFKVNNLSVINLATQQLVVSNNTSYEQGDNQDIRKYKELILVTCYPFEGVSSDTNLRYIVKLI